MRGPNKKKSISEFHEDNSFTSKTHGDDWLVTYTDLVTLLITLFIVMIAHASFEKVEEGGLIPFLKTNHLLSEKIISEDTPLSRGDVVYLGREFSDTSDNPKPSQVIEVSGIILDIKKKLDGYIHNRSLEEQLSVKPEGSGLQIYFEASGDTSANKFISQNDIEALEDVFHMLKEHNISLSITLTSVERLLSSTGIDNDFIAIKENEELISLIHNSVNKTMNLAELNFVKSKKIAETELNSQKQYSVKILINNGIAQQTE